MIKVINVSSDSNIGGAGRCILTFLKNYDRSRFEVVMVLPSKSELIPAIKALKTRYIELDGIHEKSFSLSAVSKLVAIFNKEKPNIVHAHASFSARIAAKIAGIPIVYTRHSVFPNNPKITKGVGKLIAGFANNSTSDRIIAVAGAAKDNLTETGVDESKIAVIKNGVEKVRKFSAEEITEAKAKYGIKDEFVFGIIARVEDIKGHLYFAQAAKKIVKQNNNVKFIVCGTGSYLNTVKQKVMLENLKDYFIFTGYLNDVSPIVNIIDVNINASYGTEATSLALLEGMSIGKPIVASDYGGNPELVEKSVNGLLFKTKNSDDMADKMLEIMNDAELYKNLSRGAERLYEEKYTAKIYASNIENIYKSLVKERKL